MEIKIYIFNLCIVYLHESIDVHRVLPHLFKSVDLLPTVHDSAMIIDVPEPAPDIPRALDIQRVIM